MIFYIAIKVVLIFICLMVCQGQRVLTIEFITSGARSPLPGNPNHLMGTTWNENLGDLTPIGKSQHYSNGQSIRNLLIQQEAFLNPSLNIDEIYVASSNYTRCIQSATELINGMFPVRNESSNVAINILSSDKDYLLNGFSPTLCPAVKYYQKAQFENANSIYEKQLQPLYSNLKSLYQAPDKNMTIEGIYDYADTYRCAEINGTASNINLPSSFLIPNYFGYYFYQALLKAEEVQKFATSQLFKYLVDVLSGKMRAIEKIGQYTDFNTNVKYILLSGNEELLISLIKYYIPNPLETNPPFASTVLVNLFKEDGQYYVTFEINGSIIKLGSACKESTKCELSKVVYALNEKVIPNIEEKCNDIKNLESQGLPGWALALIIVGGLVFIAIMIALFSIKIQKDRKKYNEEFRSALINP